MTNELPFVSIVIPVHNGENYIQDTLESMLKQAYQNFEIITLENCSSDRTVEIVRSFQDSRIQIIPSERLLTIEQNWGRIVDLDLKEYLCIFCHDDPMYPGYLQEIVRLIETEPDASIYHTKFELINDKGERTTYLNNKEPYKETGAEFLRNVHEFREYLRGSGYVARSADFKRVGGLPPFKRLLFSDIFCWYELALMSYKVCSPQAFYGIHIHQESTGNQSQLFDFYEAGNSYLQALTEDKRVEARDYLTKFFRSRQRLLLEEVIRDTQPNRLESYEQLKQHLLTKTNDTTFAIEFDHPVVHLMEMIARLPLRVLRVLLFTIFQTALIAKHRIQQYFR